MTHGKRAQSEGETSRDAAEETRRVLLVGASRALPRAMTDLVGASVVMADFADITAEFLEETAPDVILAPLFATEFDITDLAARLAYLGYEKALHAYTRPLPAPGLVVSEIRATWPKMKFELIELPVA